MNPYANETFGLKNVKVAADANEEMMLVGKIDTKNEVVVDESFCCATTAKLTPDSSAHIALISYKPNHPSLFSIRNLSVGCFFRNLL